MHRLLKVLAAVPLFAGMAMLGASLNDNRTSWDVPLRIGAVALFLVSAAITAWLFRSGVFDHLTSKGIAGVVIGAIGFALVVVGDGFSGALRVVGIVTVISGGAILQKSYDAQSSADGDKAGGLSV